MREVDPGEVCNARGSGVKPVQLKVDALVNAMPAYPGGLLAPLAMRYPSEPYVAPQVPCVVVSSPAKLAEEPRLWIGLTVSAIVVLADNMPRLPVRVSE